MKKKKKINYKWLKWSVLGAIAVVIALGIMLLIYVAGHQDNLSSYQQSIENLVEVDQVLDFSHYTGQEAYFVARIQRTDGEQYYYFVKDDIVAHQVLVADVITADIAQSVAMESVGSGSILSHQLGIYHDKPIYEVKLRTNEGTDYVIINALTMEIVFQFTLN